VRLRRLWVEWALRGRGVSCLLLHLIPNDPLGQDNAAAELPQSRENRNSLIETIGDNNCLDVELG
jgi:hypothetical protein